jgi:hypothetical protein
MKQDETTEAGTRPDVALVPTHPRTTQATKSRHADRLAARRLVEKGGQGQHRYP